MTTNKDAFSTTRRRRRQHSPHFKAELVSLCQQPGISMAAVALEHGLNANLLRRWVTEHERYGRHALHEAEPKAHDLAPYKEMPPANWLSVDMQSASLPKANKVQALAKQTKVSTVAKPSVTLNLSGRDDLHLTLQWPSDETHNLAGFIRELLT